MARKNFGNVMIASMLKSPQCGMLGGPTGLIRVGGQKTGRTISTPVNYICDGDLLRITGRREQTAMKVVLRGEE